MRNKLLIYPLIVVLLVATSFWGGYYFKGTSKEVISEKPVEKVETQTVQLKDGETADRLDGIVFSVDATKNPAEIVVFVTPDPNRFMPPLPLNLRRTILVYPNIHIVAGKFGQRTGLSEIDITDLRQGDSLVIQTHESILDLFTRDTYTAVAVRKVVRD